MFAAPRTKVEEISDQLRKLINVRQEVDAFTLQRFKRDILRNLNTDPLNGFYALQMVSVFEWDEAQLHETHRKACDISRSSNTYIHYATSLQMIGMYEQAAEAALTASQKCPEDLHFLRRAIVYHQNAGLFRRSRELIDLFNIRSPLNSYESAHHIDNAIGALNANGTSDETIADCNRLAFELLRRNRVTHAGVQITADNQDNYVMFFIYVNADEEQVSSLDDALGIELFDKISDFHPDRYWVGYIKAKDEHDAD